MRSTLLLATALSAFAFGATAQANDGELDATYGTDAVYPGYGFYLNPYGAFSGTGEVLRAAPNGQLYLFGEMKDSANTTRNSIMRLDADGYPDYDFGEAGLRTYQQPCSNGFVTDAQIDAQGRMWLSFGSCPDMTVYRFLPNGDLDLSLLGTGVLSIPFDLGDDNIDRPQRIAITQQGDIVIAGLASATPARRLAIAYYTADGAPKPGFGVNGKVDLTADHLINSIGGVHVMFDGRIVITGRYAPNLMAAEQTVVRLHANGAVDAGFGNVAPGVSHVNMATVLGDGSKHILSEGSLLEHDGSILQVGAGEFGGPNSSYDFVVLKWRPDGQLDTGIGAHGYRSYSLDFAGPNPSEIDHNFDRAYEIVRQGDGKYVIIGEAYSEDGHDGLGVIRLKSNFDLDPTFGVGGKLRVMSEVGINGANCMGPVNPLMQSGRIVTATNVCVNSGVFAQATVGLTNDLLFADGAD